MITCLLIFLYILIGVATDYFIDNRTDIPIDLLFILFWPIIWLVFILFFMIILIKYKRL